jgi:hypothetical protein
MGRAILGGCGGMLACNRTHSHLTTKRLLALSFHSGTLMHAFVASPEGRTVDVGYTTNGELVALSDVADYDSAMSRLKSAIAPGSSVPEGDSAASLFSPRAL